VPSVTEADVVRMRDALFFEGPDRNRKLSRFWLMLVLAAVIASAGVAADSTATVIGAMIVAPLMVPILGSVLAVILLDRDNLLRCMALVITGAAAVIAVGWLVGLLVPTDILAATNSQVAGRVTPRLIDLLAALATGAVGSIALARNDISDTLPGVAIAISLVPPLAVVGLTLEAGATDQALGALLLFLTNVCAILTTGLLVMAIFRVQRHVPVSPGGNKQLHRGRAVAATLIALVVVAVPLSITSRRIAQTEGTESTVSGLAENWATDVKWEIASVTTGRGGVVVRATGELPEPATGPLRAAIARAGLGGTRIRIELVPSHTVGLSAE
jgi:uncharacterized hydrophobic protein (TIGR00271 family)